MALWMKAQVMSAEVRLLICTVFPPLKQPYILICNICARRAFQNGCSLEDDCGVCSKLGFGAFGKIRLCTDVSIPNVNLSFAWLPREIHLKESARLSSSVLKDHFIFISQCKNSRRLPELGLLSLISKV